MAKLVILDLQQDSPNQGVQVSVEIGEEERRPTFRDKGFLPANRPLFRILDQWRGSYRGLSISYRELTLKTVQLSGSIQSRKDDCRQIATELQEQFQTWLRTDTFKPIGDGLREQLNPQDQIRILLRTDSAQLRQLPWQEWDFLDRYPGAEVILSASVSEQVLTTRTQSVNPQGKVRILAVLGGSEGIEVERDRTFLETFSPDAEICFLPQPTRAALHDALWDQPWDIFFFAGHSHTEGEQGVISLNDQEKLPLQDLKEGLQKAIANSLEIAIFNSCDGLGLARDLERLNIPQLIVMREPVPDQVAQQFLKNLLPAYSSGLPLHLAVRDARKKLRILENEYPCASSLPILCQNPTAPPPPTWHQLRTGGRIAGNVFGDQAASNVFDPAVSPDVIPKPEPPPVRAFSYRKAVFRAALISVVLTAILTGLQSLGLFQAMELNAYDHFMRLRPAEGPDGRFLLITVNEADKRYQESLKMDMQGSLADDAIAEIIRQAGDYPPRVLATSIFRDHQLSEQLLTALDSIDNVFMVCEMGDTIAKVTGTAPPSNFPIENVGFSDAFVLDPDNVIRRQALGMSPKQICPTSRSLALQVATAYLEPEGYSYNSGDPLARIVSIGNVPMPKLTHNTGGYQLPLDDALGYQLLVNYRAHPPRSVELTTVLNGSAIAQEPKLFEDKILMIGLASSSEDSESDSTDVNWTPYELDRTYGSPGIALHAQMASQIISAVLDDRPLIRGASPLVKILWTLIWAVVATVSLLLDRNTKQGMTLFLVQLLAFQGIYYLLFLQGIWLPYGLIMSMYLILGFSIPLGFHKLRLK
ncbi:CHASE2 domain-containing protein [Leptolyngbya sp. PCC 6406]|uniref:CHASE2 domain-containing protein n=1 Tax=Leptolyngbya sp. PCC 6406 TaxID=1173264 RepID=UPI0002AC9A6C|nr:CHASE2 domain-containing protein [Leptolyngbya sp. PCC 6406]